MISIPLWQGNTHDCGYLPEQVARSAFVNPHQTLDPLLYSRLIERGFRRSGDYVYRPNCENCRACIPTRIPVKEFQTDRAQRRCLKRNAQTRAVIKNAEYDPRHWQLYQQYQHQRHPKPDEHSSPDDYMHFLSSHWCDTVFVEFLIEGQLAAVAVVDRVDHGLSAVYTYFDPAFAHYSPGVYAVLWQIDYAKRLGLPYLYLGYWIRECRKMSYKSQYRPLSCLIDGEWQTPSDYKTQLE